MTNAEALRIVKVLIQHYEAGYDNDTLAHVLKAHVATAERAKKEKSNA